MEFVKVSQSPGMTGGVAVRIGVVPVGVIVAGDSVGVGEWPGSPGVKVGVGDKGGNVGVSEGGSVGPDTVISTNHGSFPFGPIPKFVPLEFRNIQNPR